MAAILNLLIFQSKAGHEIFNYFHRKLHLFYNTNDVERTIDVQMNFILS